MKSPGPPALSSSSSEGPLPRPLCPPPGQQGHKDMLLLSRLFPCHCTAPERRASFFTWPKVSVPTSSCLSSAPSEGGAPWPPRRPGPARDSSIDGAAAVELDEWTRPERGPPRPRRSLEVQDGATDGDRAGTAPSGRAPWRPRPSTPTDRREVDGSFQIKTCWTHPSVSV